jgi:hypothetical protein
MHKSVLDSFARYRFRGEPMSRKYQKYYDGYRQIIGERNVADFDTPVSKTAELLRIETVAAEVRTRWDAVLLCVPSTALFSLAAHCPAPSGLQILFWRRLCPRSSSRFFPARRLSLLINR